MKEKPEKKIRLGIVFRPEHPPEALPDFARRAEEACFDELWVWEDCFFVGGIASAATALAVTDRITIGLGVMPDPHSTIERKISFISKHLRQSFVAGQHRQPIHLRRGRDQRIHPTQTIRLELLHPAAGQARRVGA